MEDLDTSIADHEEGIKTDTSDIAALEDGIKALDKSVAEATEQRKEEHQDFSELMAGDAAAKELIGFAKNRMNKFYNPKLYKAPAAFVQISAHVQRKANPGPPPAAEFGGKKTEESSGVIAMMDDLTRDLDKEMTEAEAEEKDAQGDYEQMMSDSADKRAEDSKSLGDKQSAKANAEADLQSDSDEKASTTKELGATLQYIDSLHAECDWLIKYFDIRKDARSSEIDAMEKAKAVLNGADFSLLQTTRALRR
jgi:septal ring factor EnvC (AmiA/AmiB activator)